jgi:hypothetical protein
MTFPKALSRAPIYYFPWSNFIPLHTLQLVHNQNCSYIAMLLRFILPLHISYHLSDVSIPRSCNQIKICPPYCTFILINLGFPILFLLHLLYLSPINEIEKEREIWKLININVQDPGQIFTWLQFLPFFSRCLDSPVGIAMWYGLDGRRIGVRVLAGAGDFSILHSVQTGSGAHQASYPMCTEVNFLGGKAAGAWS